MEIVKNYSRIPFTQKITKLINQPKQSMALKKLLKIKEFLDDTLALVAS